MHRQVIQAALVIGILSVPAFASAEGLLSSTLKNATGTVEKVTNEAVGISSEKEDSAMEEKQAVRTEEKKDSQNAVTKTLSSVTESLSTTAGKVTGSLSDGKPLIDVNLSEDPSIKVNAGAVHTEVSKKPAVKVNTGIADVNLSEKPSVKVDTGAIKTEVSESPEIKVDTKIIQADVSKNTGIKVDTDIVQADVSKDKGINVKTDAAQAEISKDKGVKVTTGDTETEGGRESVPVTPGSTPEKPEAVPVQGQTGQKEPFKVQPQQAPAIGDSPEQAGTPSPVSSAPSVKAQKMDEAAPISNPEKTKTAASVPAPVKEIQIETERPALSADSSGLVQDAVIKGTENPAIGPPEMAREKRTAITVNQIAPSASTTTLTGSSSAGAGLAAIGLLDPLNGDLIFEDPNHNGQTRQYANQWLNAPPAQPPQSSLLLTKSI